MSRSLHRMLIPCLLAATLLAGVAVADDWPQWLGPTRDGIYAETGIATEIPATGLQVRWRAAVHGGYSGPAVVDGRVFVTDYVRTDGEAFNNPDQRASLQGQERVLCFDAETGKLLWSHAYDCPYSISYPVGPRCTPTVDGQLVYTLGSEGDLLCLSTEDGQVVWQRSLKRDLGAPVPIWGFAAHPLVEGELLICMVGGENQTVVAFDKTSGEVRWRALNASAPGYCAPSIVDAGGARQLVVWHADALQSLNPADGSLHWTVAIKPSYGMAIARPQRSGDRLYASSIHSEAVMLRLLEDRPAVEELWRGEPKQAVYCANSTPIVHGGAIYGTDGNVGSLIAVNADTGQRLWETFQATRPEETRFVKHGTAFLTRLADSDRYLVFSEVGDLIMARLTPKGYEERGRFHVVDPTSEAFGRNVVWSHPAYAGKTIYARNDKELVAVALPTAESP